MVFVLVSYFFTRHVDDVHVEPEEKVESGNMEDNQQWKTKDENMSFSGFSQFSGFFYLLGLMSVIGLVVSFGHCRWCSQCGVHSPHFEYEEI